MLLIHKSMIAESYDPKAAVEAVPKLIQVLTPLTPEDRQRALTAAMVLLGQSFSSAAVKINTPRATEESNASSENISAKASAWMKKHSVTREHLDHVFAIDAEEIDVIAARMPGGGKKQQTVQAYLICGLKYLLQIGDPSFPDKDARAVCLKVGCYDSPNHALYMKAFENLINGSKDAGWKLTNPGLSKAAEIVRQLAP
jgi:hypothetical protein